jgi:DNA-binding transcriptional regulator YiaG
MWQIVAMSPGDHTSEDFEASLKARLEEQGRRLQELEVPELGAIRELVQALDQVYRDLLRQRDLSGLAMDLVRQSALQGSSPALLLYRSGRTEAAWNFVVTSCEQISQAFGARRPPYSGPVQTLFPSSTFRSLEDMATHLDREREFLAAFNNVVFEHVRHSAGQVFGREIVRRLMTHLALSYDQLGRALNLSGETVRRWERGTHPIPEDRMAELIQADAALARLLEVFQPERLPQVLRRKADLFQGDTALDLILRGRLGDVADRYEVALAYQG